MEVGQKLLNRYVIENLIGEGSTAAVYQARDTRLGRRVAVKVLSPFVGTTARARFAREARSAAALNHPNIMAIYDEAQEEGMHFLIVEYVEGKPLTDFIPTTPAVVANIGIQLCHALSYAHRMNIIHRDIKPANIKITAEGLAKIMDMGLAMAPDAQHVTAHDAIIGTPAYLSPEQARGHKLDHRTDIYSLGVVLYEMATGRLPFDSHNISALLMQKVTQDPDPPRKWVPNLPRALDEAIARAMHRNPDRRYQIADDLAAALGHETSSVLLEVSGITLERDLDSLVRATEEAAPTGGLSKPLTVIVADDHLILRTSLVYFLDDQEDVRVLGEAGTGAEALELCAHEPPDVLLLDLNMPGQSGLKILPLVRKRYPETRVLVLTGRAEDAYIMRALQAGAHGYLLKTSSQEELIDAVRRVAAGHMVLGTGVAEKVISGALTPHERDPLSEYERAMLLAIVSGAESNEALAAHLGLEPEVIVAQLSRLIDKLGANSRSEAALVALRAGWITLDEAHQP
ncbi:MAG: protein kinase [Anaerolineae bacterium]|nr:protein kinase [Anaerolineae bacterium]